MKSTNSEDIASQYARLIKQQDDYVNQLVTCKKTHPGCHGHHRKAGRCARDGYRETNCISPSFHGTGSEPKGI